MFPSRALISSLAAAFRLLLFTLLLLVAADSHAGDPLFRDALGKGVGWDPSQPVSVWLYEGGLPRVTAGEIRAEVEEAIRLWSSVPRSQLDIRFQGMLPGPLTAEKFDTAIFRNPTDPLNPAPLRNGILIVPDVDGKLLDHIQPGLSRGAFGMAWTHKRDTDPFITLSVIFLNGKYLSPEKMPDTFRHELGHALGLAHMEANVDCGQLVTPSDPSACEDRPMLRRGMYGGITLDLSMDDAATFASLYPSDEGRGQMATIEGRLTLRSTGNPLPGAIVTAREVGNSRKNAVSSVTGVRFSRRGEFSITGLMPGEYRLEVAPILARPGGGDTLGDNSSPFPALPSPASFKGVMNGQELPLEKVRLKVEGGETYTVSLISDDVNVTSFEPPKMVDAAAVMRGDVIYAQVEVDNPNGEPLAVWEKRLTDDGTTLNPGVWLWDQSNSLGVKRPLLQMTFNAADTSRLKETKKLQLYVGGTQWYTALSDSLPGVASTALTVIPVEVEPVPGDMDRDGRLSSRDLTLALRHMVGLLPLPLKDRMQADVSPIPGAGGRIYGDGRVNLSDVIALLRRYVGLDSGSLVPTTSAQLLRFTPEPPVFENMEPLQDTLPRIRGGILIP